MSGNSDAGEPRTVLVVGGGFSGALFGLKLHYAKPDWRVVIVEHSRRLGRGIAYGSCAPEHRLNVPVSRMELGLTPGFGEWLGAVSSRRAQVIRNSDDDTADALRRVSCSATTSRSGSQSHFG